MTRQSGQDCRAKIIFEMIELSRQHRETIQDGIFMGWTPERTAAADKLKN
jgi:hypothetical protein